VRSEPAFAAPAGTLGYSHRQETHCGTASIAVGTDDPIGMTTVALVRMRTHVQTRASIARRRAEGRTTKEILLSLKRYIVRQPVNVDARLRP
jgi:hypothetical protein